MKNKTIILAGNPNVGKSTLFNTLTNSNQHTGNWTGKTVEIATGSYEYQNVSYTIYDLPGTYSLSAHSEEERLSSEFIRNTHHHVTVVVCDATCLERNLNLVLQILNMTSDVILCINLIDEAKKKGIIINFQKLSHILNIPVVPISARKQYGVDTLKETIQNYKGQSSPKTTYNSINETSTKIAKEVTTYTKENYDAKERKIDAILTHKVWGFITMFALFMLIFWITIKAANYPSELLFNIFESLQNPITNALTFLHFPSFLIDILINGIYRVLTWVISVMLPPMAIFFPLFTILEDLGYLPRIAFCLDNCFRKCSSCGKQALTMCMGFGCNAVGVTGCRIIDSKRERLIAILTNAFVPCNGRFPTLISIITIFLVGLSHNSSILSALILTLVIIIAILITLLISKILSKTILKGEPSSFTLELPPYRSPQIKSILIRSFFDRTLHILYRAIICSIPAGIIIWLAFHIDIQNHNLIEHLVNILNPIGTVIGLDGVILLAFLLGLPANEIVMPIILMIYLKSGILADISDLTSIKTILISNGWTLLTAINFIIFSLFHFPCATTILTIKKETQSVKWTILSILLPLTIGIFLCLVTTVLFS